MLLDLDIKENSFLNTNFSELTSEFKSQGIINKHPLFFFFKKQLAVPFSIPTAYTDNSKHEKSGTVHGFKTATKPKSVSFCQTNKNWKIFNASFFFPIITHSFIFERLPMNCQWQNNHCTYSCDLCCYKIQFDNDKKNEYYPQ